MSDDDDNNSAGKAVARLAQVQSHLATSSPPSPPPPKPRRRSRRNTSTDPPADYSDRLGQLDHLRKLAKTPDPSRRGYQRQKAAGKLWVRERVTALLDRGSLREVGSVTGDVKWSQTKDANGRHVDAIDAFTPSNSVQGFGALAGRKILFTADDYSLRAGHADGALWEKTAYIEKLALSLRIPIVKLVDGSSGGGSVTTIAKAGFSYIPPLPSFEFAVQQLNAGIPNLGAVLGPAIGLGAARVTMCHFSVMAADVGALFNAGPAVVANATFEHGLLPHELGGPAIHCTNGTIDNAAPSEAAAFRQLRTVLAYLPNSGLSAPPVLPGTDPPTRREPALNSLIPRRKERTYDARRAVTLIVDADSFFEIGAQWGPAAIVGLARLAGRPVGIVASNPESPTAGALDTPTCAKISRHLKLCDVMNLPLLQLVDVPGYAVGSAAERTGTMRAGVGLALAYYATSTPVFSVVVRRAYGVAGGAMLDCRSPRTRIAWPSGDWGSLPLAGGIEAGHAAELREAAAQGGPGKAKEVYAGLQARYERLMNPVRTAAAFGVEDIIAPERTRELVCAWAAHVYDELMPVRLQERVAGKLHVAFA